MRKYETICCGLKRLNEMGVGFSHGDARWSYSGFNQMRCELGLLLGLELVDTGLYDGHKYPVFGHLADSHLLKVFLNLSDCDAKITPRMCASLCTTLKDWANFLTYYNKVNLFKMAQGMELAAFLNEEFSFH